jgi:hypothetical protein
MKYMSNFTLFVVKISITYLFITTVEVNPLLNAIEN